MSRGAAVKRLLVAILAINLLTLPIATADSKGKEVKSVKKTSLKCATTKAVGHDPKVIAPAQKLPKKLARTFTFDTNCGKIVITTVGAKAPVTITQLSTLAKGGFFNNTLCHRLTTRGLYVLQCGDPKATGTGGPNFRYGDENLPRAKVNNYPAGTVAMANSGPGTNGSQFFLVFEDSTLGPNYTIWGTITQGLELIKAIGEAGVKGGGADGTPNQTVAINSVKVDE
jgi:peptidyl-prolyl cis-trans isomerase B (cyclophilin B)